MTEENKNYLDYNGLKIDPLIFTMGFVPKCDMDICGGQCCNWGVYMDKDFKPVILEHEKDIIETMDNNQIKDSELWFEKEYEPDTDFPSGLAIGTELYTMENGEETCVFKNKIGFCTLQMTAVKKGMHKWAIKPKYCIMYPITIIDGVLTCDDEHSKRLDYCGIHHPENFVHSVFEAMTEEIKYIIGDDGYNFLLEHFEKNYKNKS
jgi:hypothetical protein